VRAREELKLLNKWLRKEEGSRSKVDVAQSTFGRKRKNRTKRKATERTRVWKDHEPEKVAAQKRRWRSRQGEAHRQKERDRKKKAYAYHTEKTINASALQK
jgi:hypothetical protein